MDDPLAGRKILVIDDDPDLLELVGVLFSRAGAIVITACDGEEGLRRFYADRPHLVILDLMMPGMDGWEACRSLRQLSNVPIIMLTALTSTPDVARGLDGGADDYVTKPFANRVLLARARALMRRSMLPATNEKPVRYDDDYLAVDLERRRVMVRGKTVRLTPTEYRLLAYLVQHPGQVLTYEQILEQVWGPEVGQSWQYVQVYIYRLRRKLEKDPRRPRYLLAEPGVGYCFEGWPAPR
jgi:two-component system KDP operon response regulator KdpE